MGQVPKIEHINLDGTTFRVDALSDKIQDLCRQYDYSNQVREDLENKQKQKENSAKRTE